MSTHGFFEFHHLYCISVLFQVRSLSSASLTTATGDLQTQATERNTRTSTQGETSQCCFLNTSISSDKPNNISVAAFFAVINRITAKCEAATSPTPTHPLSGDFLLFLDFHLFKSHVPSITPHSVPGSTWRCTGRMRCASSTAPRVRKKRSLQPPPLPPPLYQRLLLTYLLPHLLHLPMGKGSLLARLTGTCEYITLYVMCLCV